MKSTKVQIPQDIISKQKENSDKKLEIQNKYKTLLDEELKPLVDESEQLKEEQKKHIPEFVAFITALVAGDKIKISKSGKLLDASFISFHDDGDLKTVKVSIDNESNIINLIKLDEIYSIEKVAKKGLIQRFFSELFSK